MAIKDRQKKRNKITQDENPLAIAMARCRDLVEDGEYKISLERRLRSGNLPAQMETLIWHYAYGKPPESVLLGEDNDHPFLGQRLLRAQALLEARRSAAKEPPHA